MCIYLSYLGSFKPLLSKKYGRLTSQSCVCVARVNIHFGVFVEQWFRPTPIKLLTIHHKMIISKFLATPEVCTWSLHILSHFLRVFHLLEATPLWPGIGQYGPVWATSCSHLSALGHKSIPSSIREQTMVRVQFLHLIGLMAITEDLAVTSGTNLFGYILQIMKKKVKSPQLWITSGKLKKKDSSDVTRFVSAFEWH